MIKAIDRACYAYNGKTQQINQIIDVLGKNYVKVVLYDDMVKKPDITFKDIFEFLDLKYSGSYIDDTHSKSIKKKNKLSKKEKEYIIYKCQKTYESTLKYI